MGQIKNLAIDKQFVDEVIKGKTQTDAIMFEEMNSWIEEEVKAPVRTIKPKHAKTFVEIDPRDWLEDNKHRIF